MEGGRDLVMGCGGCFVCGLGTGGICCCCCCCGTGGSARPTLPLPLPLLPNDDCDAVCLGGMGGPSDIGGNTWMPPILPVSPLERTADGGRVGIEWNDWDDDREETSSSSSSLYI